MLSPDRLAGVVPALGFPKDKSLITPTAAVAAVAGYASGGVAPASGDRLPGLSAWHLPHPPAAMAGEREAKGLALRNRRSKIVVLIVSYRRRLAARVPSGQSWMASDGDRGPRRQPRHGWPTEAAMRIFPFLRPIGTETPSSLPNMERRWANFVNRSAGKIGCQAWSNRRLCTV